MAFDPQIHTIDAAGFHRHKEHGHLIGIEGTPPAKHPEDGGEWPKWVIPHPGHVHRHHHTGHVTTPHFAEHHVDRHTGEVSVLVRDHEDERRALIDPQLHAA